MIFQLVGFVIISAVLVFISRASLRDPHSHGFYRFFAWEAIAALSLLNLPVWFVHPFAWHQLISWILLIISMFLVIAGLRLLQTTGNPQPERQDPTLLPLEKTTTLVTTGLYCYIRHPLYSSLLFLAWGVFFKQPAWLGLALAAAATFFLHRTARMEEQENVRFFGAAYQDYMQRTRMFIPGLY